jgi:hypothetical protein
MKRIGVGIGNAVGTYATTAPEKSIAKSSRKFTRKNGTTPQKPHLLTHGTKEWGPNSTTLSWSAAA